MSENNTIVAWLLLSKSMSCKTHGYGYLAGYNPEYKGPKLGKVLTVWF